VERMVIDVFGQMWGTMLINGMTALCILTGMAGVCIRERLAIGVVRMWSQSCSIWRTFSWGAVI